MTLQRRHFELIAETLREHTFSVSAEDNDYRRNLMAMRFASKLALTNPNFNRAKFLKACGVEG